MFLNKEFIQKALSGCSLLYKDSVNVREFVIDSRTVQKGDFFVALAGQQTDGHNFVTDALQSGASGCLIADNKQDCLAKIDKKMLANLCVIIVPDVKKALGQLAKSWRAQFEYPVVGVTGSVGKTTVKNLISSMLLSSGIAHAVSRGNQNTYIGLCLTVLKMKADHQAAVFECGITRRGEMKRLADIARPTVGVITNVGHSHMEGLGNLTDIAAEKRALFTYFKENDIGIINGDQQFLASVGYPHPTVKFGTKTTNQIQARKIALENGKVSFLFKLYHEKTPITLNEPHKGMVFNVLSASAAAHIIGCSFTSIIESLKRYEPEQGRFETIALNNDKGVLINDSYNASPESMKEALLALQAYESNGDKIAILGDMLELGMHSPFWHRQLGRFLRKVPSLKKVVLVGNEVEWTKKTLPVGLEVEHVPTWKAAVEVTKTLKTKNAIVLVKGSRGVQLDKLVNEFVQSA